MGQMKAERRALWQTDDAGRESQMTRLLLKARGK